MTTIAVVNDDTQFLRMMQVILTDAGYKMLPLHEQSEAFEELRTALPEMVILDLRLQAPNGGWMILDLLKLDRSTENIPVVVCSAAHDELLSKEEHLARLNTRVLLKPFKIETLLDLVHEIVGPSD